MKRSSIGTDDLNLNPEFNLNFKLIDSEAQAQDKPNVPVNSNVGLREELMRLRRGVAKRTKTLYEAALKAEDLEGIFRGLQRTRQRISEKRRLRNLRSARQAGTVPR